MFRTIFVQETEDQEKGKEDYGVDNVTVTLFPTQRLRKKKKKMFFSFSNA